MSRWSRGILVRAPVLLLALLVVLLVSVFMAAPVTVTLDGYSHLYGGIVLRALLRGAPEARAAFLLNSALLPNWSSTLLLGGLSSVFSPELSLKLLVLSVATLFGAGLYFCLGASSLPRQDRAAMLVVLLPFTLNVFLILGYYGFLISAAVCLFVLGLVLRHGLAMTLRQQLGVAGLLLLAYVSHPLPVVISGLFPIAHLIADAFVHRSAGWRRSVAAMRRDGLALWPWVPSAGLVGWYSLQLSQVQARAAVVPPSETTKVVALVHDAALSISPASPVGTLAIALMALLLAGVLVRPRESVERDRVRFTTLAIIAGAVMVLSAIAPDRVGDGMGVVPRLLFHGSMFLVLLALGEGRLQPRLLGLCVLVSSLSVLDFAREYSAAVNRLAPGVAELRQAMEEIPAHSRVVILGYRTTLLCEGGPLLKLTLPERHAAMAGAAENELIVLNDYEGYTTHFPLRYADWRYRPLDGEYDAWSEWQRTGWLEVLKDDPNVDYVVSWGVSGDDACRPGVGAPYVEALHERFDPIVMEEGRSRVQLWRRHT